MLNKSICFLLSVMTLSCGYGAGAGAYDYMYAPKRPPTVASNYSDLDTNKRPHKRPKTKKGAAEQGECSTKRKEAVYPPVYDPAKPFNFSKALLELGNKNIDIRDFLNITYHCCYLSKKFPQEQAHLLETYFNKNRENFNERVTSDFYLLMLRAKHQHNVYKKGSSAK